MITTALHIAHLLPSRRELAVGGFGVFGRLVIPSSYDPASHLLTPPSVRIIFEHDTRCTSSPELTASLMRAHGMSADEAARRIEADAAAMEDAIRREGSLAIPGAGMIVYNGKFGEFTFRTDDDFLDESAYGWLEPLFISPLQTEESKPAEVAATAESAEERAERIARKLEEGDDGERRLIFRRWSRIAGSAAAAIGVFGLVALLTVLNTHFHQPADSANMASVGINTSAPAGIVAPVAPQNDSHLVLVVRTPDDGVSEARVRPDRRIDAAEASAATENTSPAQSVPEFSTPVAGGYCMIVASLASRAEAESFLAAHSNGALPLRIVETQGRYRIATLSGSTPGGVAAEARASGVYDAFPQAWVCRE